MGCDGVVLKSFSDRAGMATGTGWDLLDPGAWVVDAVCIVFPDRHRPSPPAADGSFREPPADHQLIDGDDPDAHR